MGGRRRGRRRRRRRAATAPAASPSRAVAREPAAARRRRRSSSGDCAGQPLGSAPGRPRPAHAPDHAGRPRLIDSAAAIASSASRSRPTATCCPAPAGARAAPRQGVPAGLRHLRRADLRSTPRRAASRTSSGPSPSTHRSSTWTSGCSRATCRRSSCRSGGGPDRSTGTTTCSIDVAKLHFLVPPLLAFALWMKRRALFFRFASAMLALSFAAALTFLLFPAAPPWAAGKTLLTPTVTKIDDSTWTSVSSKFSLSKPRSRGTRTPRSRRSTRGYAMLCFLFVAVLVWRKRWRWFVIVPAALYPLALSFVRVYSGDHYVDRPARRLASTRRAAYFGVGWYWRRNELPSSGSLPRAAVPSPWARQPLLELLDRTSTTTTRRRTRSAGPPGTRARAVRAARRPGSDRPRTSLAPSAGRPSSGRARSRSAAVEVAPPTTRCAQIVHATQRQAP